MISITTHEEYRIETTPSLLTSMAIVLHQCAYCQRPQLNLVYIQDWKYVSSGSHLSLAYGEIHQVLSQKLGCPVLSHLANLQY